jgi:predicted RNA-binding protein YlxR (DUF448 family)
MQGRPNHEGLDSGPRQTPPGSERFCAATGAVRPVAEMIRFVVAPDGTVVPDLKRRLPGRGLWITATAPALRDALARKAFARGFKRQVQVAADFVETTDRLLERAALDALAIAHKAGITAIGFGKAEAALARERVVGLIHAADAAADGVRKLDAALRQRPNAENIDVISLFASAQLNLALGRSNVIHAALLAGPESETVLARAARLRRFRTGATNAPETPGIRERNG